MPSEHSRDTGLGEKPTMAQSGVPVTIHIPVRATVPDTRPNMIFRRDWAHSPSPSFRNWIDFRPKNTKFGRITIMNDYGWKDLDVPWDVALEMALHIIACHSTVRYGPTLPINPPEGD